MKHKLIEDYTYAMWDEYDDKEWINIAYIDENGFIEIELQGTKLGFDHYYELQGFISALEVIVSNAKEYLKEQK